MRSKQAGRAGGPSVVSARGRGEPGARGRRRVPPGCVCVPWTLYVCPCACACALLLSQPTVAALSPPPRSRQPAQPAPPSQPSQPSQPEASMLTCTTVPTARRADACHARGLACLPACPVGCSAPSWVGEDIGPCRRNLQPARQPRARGPSTGKARYTYGITMPSTTEGGVVSVCIMPR